MNYQALAHRMAGKKPSAQMTGPGYTGQYGGINPINQATGQRRYTPRPLLGFGQQSHTYGSSSRPRTPGRRY